MLSFYQVFFAFFPQFLKICRLQEGSEELHFAFKLNIALASVEVAAYQILILFFGYGFDAMGKVGDKFYLGHFYLGSYDTAYAVEVQNKQPNGSYLRASHPQGMIIDETCSVRL